MIEINEIRNRVIEILVRISGIPRDQIHAQSTFDELDLDSLSRIELLVDLEREFKIESPRQDDEEIFKQIQSVEEAVRLVEKNLMENEAA
jgi:acyl carrier protein